MSVQPHNQPQEPAELPLTRRHRLWPWLIVLGALGAAGYGLYRWWPQILSQTSAGTKGPATQPARALPVITATALQGDLPIYLNGLGTATAFNTATVRTRVDGQIMKIAFVEGQRVHEGDMLVAIDPRPFQVQLTEAQRGNRPRTKPRSRTPNSIWPGIRPPGRLYRSSNSTPRPPRWRNLRER